MPPRRQAKAESPEPDLHADEFSEDDEFGFLESQHSNGSDEAYQQQLRETLEKLQAAERAKKREQKEKKFLELVEKQLTLDIANPAKDLHAAMKKMDQAYQKFLHDYATVEDRIHKKLGQIVELEDKLTRLFKARQLHDDEEVKKASTMHVDGLSKMRSSCKGFEKIVDQLVLATQDEEK